MARAHLSIIGIILGMSVTPAWGQWAEFVDDTTNRLVAAPDVGIGQSRREGLRMGRSRQ